MSTSLLTNDQSAALAKVTEWLPHPTQRFFTLVGGAGTGKSFLIQQICREHQGSRQIYLTAPTNKAANVLTEMAVKAGLVGVIGKTIYSLLGLRMEPDGEVLVLKSSTSMVHIPENSLIVLDEAGMAQSEIVDLLVEMCERKRVKLLNVGDPLQLPPVKENRSKIWKLVDPGEEDAPNPFFAELNEVVRFDSSILKLSMRIRKAIQQKKWIDENYDGTMIRKTRIDVESEDGEIEKGIVVHKTQSRFLKTALENSNADTFRDTKIIAWRNKAVNNYNARVREALGFKQQYEKGELLMIASPIELNGTIIASIDEEIVVTDYSESTVKIGNGSLVPIYKLTCERLSYLQAGDVLWLNVCKDETTLASYLNKLAYSAHNAANQKERALYWKEFWETKKKFHSVRYSYAITAHRAQGSTYKTVFIDQADILANSDDRTAFKCLLVATTRPTDLLHTY